MKPQFAIASVVVAVLATVVVEETRIAKLRDELNRLKAIPADTPPIVPVADDPGEPGVPDQPADGTLEPPDSGETTVTPAASPVGFRAVPEDYPEPAPERVKALALSPYALLHLELGLNPRECAYLDDLLEQRARSLQQLAGRWLAADEQQRATIAQEVEDAAATSDEAIRGFLKRDADYETFAAFHALQPERQLLAQLAPLMDANGVSLPLEKERALVGAMHRARIGTGSIDWDSPEGLLALVGEDPAGRFETEWNQQAEALEPDLKKILSEEEAAAFREARAQVGENKKASLAEAAEALGG